MRVAASREGAAGLVAPRWAACQSAARTQGRSRRVETIRGIFTNAATRAPRRCGVRGGHRVIVSIANPFARRRRRGRNSHRLGLSRRKSSASFTKRQRGTDSPFAMLAATAMLGIRSPRSTKEIIFEDRSLRSASCSCVSFFAIRYRRTASAKNPAKSSNAIYPSCRSRNMGLQEQLFHFEGLTQGGRFERMNEKNTSI